jgi:glycosyltransferase involved in cell wall biosynthesis
MEEAPTRYRITQYQPFFFAQGCQLKTVVWPRERHAQKLVARSITANDVVVLQRRLPSAAIIRELASRAGRMVFDFDDAVIFSDSARRTPRLLLDRWLRFKKLVRCCHTVTAGNAYLADLASRHTARDHVVIVPTTLDLKKYPVQFASGSVRLRLLGWIGCHSTLPYLYRLRNVLHRLAKTYPDLRLRVICDCPPDLPEIRTEWKPWNSETEVQDLSQVSVGLAPLPDDRWTRGKCGLRLLQYLACRVPSVASAVGTQRQIIESGGALPAATDEQWCTAIRSLLDDQHTAESCVEGGLSLVTQFDLNRWGPVVQEAWCGRNLINHQGTKPTNMAWCLGG